MANINDKVGAYAFCDQDYPKRIAFAFLNAVLNAFQKKIGDEWKKYKTDESLEVHDIKQVDYLTINSYSLNIRILKMLIKYS